MEKVKFSMKSLILLKEISIIQILVMLEHLGFGIKEIFRMIINMEMELFFYRMDRYLLEFGMKIQYQVKVHLQQKLNNRFMEYGKEIF